MPSIPLHPPAPSRASAVSNLFPSLIHTPSGLALLEIQGTLHFSSSNLDSSSHPPHHNDSSRNHFVNESSIGRIVFPDYDPSSLGDAHLGWTKRVYLYVGKHQRLTGEVKKLAKPVAVLRKAGRGQETEMDTMGDEGCLEGSEEHLEIMEIVRYKILFAGRPEPVGE
jgi:chromosome transmission fidelity protein 8